ncbi:MAG: hypothetical protein ACJ0BM_07250 [bacterium]
MSLGHYPYAKRLSGPTLRNFRQSGKNGKSASGENNGPTLFFYSPGLCDKTILS